MLKKLAVAFAETLIDLLLDLLRSGTIHTTKQNQANKYQRKFQEGMPIPNKSNFPL